METLFMTIILLTFYLLGAAVTYALLDPESRPTTVAQKAFVVAAWPFVAYMAIRYR